MNAQDGDGRNPMYYSRKSSINGMLHDAMTGIHTHMCSIPSVAYSWLSGGMEEVPVDVCRIVNE